MLTSHHAGGNQAGENCLRRFPGRTIAGENMVRGQAHMACQAVNGAAAHEPRSDMNGKIHHDMTASYSVILGTWYPASSSNMACKPACTRSVGQAVAAGAVSAESDSPGSSGGSGRDVYCGLPLRYSTGTAILPLISARSNVAVSLSFWLVNARLRTDTGLSGSDGGTSAYKLEESALVALPLFKALGSSTRLWTALPFSVSASG